MKQNETNVGIWLDHKEAWIMRFDGAESEPVHLKSHCDHDRHSREEGQFPRRADRHGCARPRTLEGRRCQQLDRFYGEILKYAAEADRIAIIGPGLAKRELEGELISWPGMGSRLRAVEASDYLTTNEIAAHFRKMFGSQGSSTPLSI